MGIKNLQLTCTEFHKSHHSINPSFCVKEAQKITRTSSKTLKSTKGLIHSFPYYFFIHTKSMENIIHWPCSKSYKFHKSLSPSLCIKETQEIQHTSSKTLKSTKKFIHSFPYIFFIHTKSMGIKNLQLACTEFLKSHHSINPSFCIKEAQT